MKWILSLVPVAVIMVMAVSSQRFDCGQGLFSNEDGCCPINIDGSVFYPDALSCYPILTAAGVQYPDAEGCYPGSNGIYKAQDKNCTNECKVQCFKSTADPTSPSPSPSSSPVVSASPSRSTSTVGSAAPSPSSSPACGLSFGLPFRRADIQPLEMMLMEIRPVALNCACNGTGVLLDQSTANSSATSDLALEKICGTTCSSNLCNDSCLRVFVAENSTQATTANDIRILNYALTLEHLEATFYTEGLISFTAEDIEAAGFTNQTYIYFTLIRDHEQTHVSALQSTITMLGGSPVQACRYNFAFANVSDFVATAMQLENVGVSAYDGALAFLTSAQLQTTGATIATVEARHASYLNLLNNMIPFPNAFDMPEAIATIYSVASAFIVSCPDEASNQVLEILRSRSSQ